MQEQLLPACVCCNCEGSSINTAAFGVKTTTKRRKKKKRNTFKDGDDDRKKKFSTNLNRFNKCYKNGHVAFFFDNINYYKINV